MRALLLKTLGILIVIEALILTVGVLPILKYALTLKSLPTIFGIIEALGGPFEALGMNSLIVAGLVFIAVSALKFLAAY